MIYFYFDYRNQREQSLHMIIYTLLRQLLVFHSSLPDIAKDLYNSCQKRRDIPDLESIKDLFLSLCSQHSSIYIIFDALDECAEDDQTRQKIFELIKGLMKDNIHLMVTGRSFSADVNALLEGSVEINIKADELECQRYIRSRIRASTTVSAMVTEELMEKIIVTITKNADGV